MLFLGGFLFSLLIIAHAVAPDGSVVVFTKGEGGYYCHKIPYLFSTLNGTLIALAEGRGRNGREACDDFSGTDLVMKRSYDGGATWSPLEVFYSNSTDTETNVIGNAAPVQNAQTGRIWMPFCRNNEEVLLSYSDDDGATWSTPVLAPHLTLPDWKWVGLGPPGGLQLSTGRLLIPGYHTTLVKGDGLISKGHTLLSDDGGETWAIGSSEFGAPYLSNECQAVELGDGSVLVNARTLTNHRMQTISHDGGVTFSAPVLADSLIQPLEGCEGSLARDRRMDTLYYSGPNTRSITRQNLTIWRSSDGGATWGANGEERGWMQIDAGSVAYSSMVVVYDGQASDKSKAASKEDKKAAPENSHLLLLYERSETLSLIFEPDQIIFYRVF
eukprot:gene25205-30446_t